MLQRVLGQLLRGARLAAPAPPERERHLVLVLMKPTVGRMVEVFQEVMEVVAAGLGELGYSTSIRINEMIDGRDHIVFAPRLLRAEDVDRIPPSTVLYNFEPLNLAVEDERRAFLAHYAPRFRVWDYSAANVRFLNGLGCRAQHVPLGYAPTLSRIARAPEQDIDVFFYGEPTDRRMRILQGLQAIGLHVVWVTDAYGTQRDALIARAKVVLNIHRDEGIRMLETPRVFYLLANRKAVVTEVMPGLEIDEDVRAAVAAVPHDRLIATCVQLVRDAERRTRLEETGFACIRARPEAKILAAALAEWA